MDPVQDLNQLTKNPTPTLADDVEEFEEKQNDFQAMYNAGGHFKEQLEQIAQGNNLETEVHSTLSEVHEVQEVLTTPEVSPELEGYMQKIEKEAELQGGVSDDYTNKVLIGPSAPQTPQVHIPLTSPQIQQGMNQKVIFAIRWLAVWCLRQMKMVSLKRA